MSKQEGIIYQFISCFGVTVYRYCCFDNCLYFFVVLNLDVVSIVAILPVTCGRGRQSGVAARGLANGYFIGRNINYGIISPKVAEYFHCKLCNSRKNL